VYTTQAKKSECNDGVAYYQSSINQFITHMAAQ